MKNTLPSVLLIAALAVLPSASFGDGLILRGGMNLANAFTKPEPASPSNREFREGFNAALLGEFGEGPARLVVGVGYENKGMHLTGAGGGDIRLDYVTIPTMLSFGTGTGYNGSRLFLNLGVESAFLVGSDYVADNFSFTFDNAREFDFALRGELGLDVPFSYSGPAGLVGIGYTYGLTDANSQDGEWRNYAFHAFLGLKFSTL